MLRLLVVVGSLGVCAVAVGQALPLADVKAKGGVQLTADELKQLMPGAKIVNMTAAGSTRRWTNNTDGTLVASSDGRGSTVTSGRNMPAGGQGTWHLADNGTYCVNIKWGVMMTEEWCSYFFKAGDKYYAARRLDDSAPTGAFDISK